MVGSSEELVSAKSLTEQVEDLGRGHGGGETDRGLKRKSGGAGETIEGEVNLPNENFRFDRRWNLQGLGWENGNLHRVLESWIRSISESIGDCWISWKLSELDVEERLDPFLAFG